MKRIPPTPTSIQLACCLLVCLVTAITITTQARAEAEAANLATVAVPSSSYVSGDTANSALNDGFDPRNSRDNRPRSYGNWPTQGTQWVQYDWPQPILTNRIRVYWWADGRGVHEPAACRLLFWNGDEFVPVPNPVGLGTATDQYNETTFDEVTTTKLRLEIDAFETFSSGILEWQVLDSGNSPAFPPSVEAGIERAVVLNGMTYLRGHIRTLATGDAQPVTIKWSKLTGPGDVTFSSPDATATTATFSETGDYVLRLTARMGALEGSDTVLVHATAPPPAAHLEPVETMAYTLDSPLWNHRAKALITEWIPHCIRKIEDPELPEGGLNNFAEAAKKLAGEQAGRHRGYVFSNAWIYNTLESICVALMVDPKDDSEIRAAQEKMRDTLDRWIPQILAAQEPDGYLQTAFTLNGWPHWSPRHRGEHEGYVAGYFLECAIAHYLLTEGNDLRLYNAAKRLADCWVQHIGPAPKQEWWDGHQAMEIALVRFGRFVNEIEGRPTGTPYIELSKFLMDCRHGGSEYDQSHVPVIEQYEAVGHAVRASYSYAGMADIAMETGDVDYLSAVTALWDNLVNKKYYLTGGIGSGETSEGFGPNYSLPHNAYCESCSSCGMIMFLHRLNMIYHDARYADLYEETLFNALLGSIDLEGANFYYQNPLDSHGFRYDWHSCPCCVGNIPRVLLMLPTWTYVRGPDAIYVNLFVGSSMTVEDCAGTDVRIVQTTNYPWDGEVKIELHPEQPREFELHIRMPNRSVSTLYESTPEFDGITALSLNGQPVDYETRRGYAVLRRTWATGDTIALTLPMGVQRVTGIDEISATQGRVALKYGPLVYAFEQVDQDLEQPLPSNTPLTTHWQEDLLGGVLTIQGEWADNSPLLAIPYYARDNRQPQTPTDATAPEQRRRRGLNSRVWVRHD